MFKSGFLSIAKPKFNLEIYLIQFATEFCSWEISVSWQDEEKKVSINYVGLKKGYRLVLWGFVLAIVEFLSCNCKLDSI